MKRFGLIIVSVVLMSIALVLISVLKKRLDTGAIQCELFQEEELFELKRGDLLVRPNSDWHPGSCAAPNGRKYGHVAFVTQGASGHRPEEALMKAKVIEALFFDQATREFQFKKEHQIREAPASVSFGSKFTGIRYRLRMNLTESQTDSMIFFLRNQLEGGYNIFSLKKNMQLVTEKKYAIENLKNKNWHCATLVWEAFYLVTGNDIDANGGLLIYPADIIASSFFNLPGGRVRF